MKHSWGHFVQLLLPFLFTFRSNLKLPVILIWIHQLKCFRAFYTTHLDLPETFEQVFIWGVLIKLCELKSHWR
jgi:hypothetical protein